MCNMLREVFPAATLTAPGQVHDHGDAANLPFLAEFKGGTDYRLGAWSTQAERAALTTKLYRWALFLKRRGKGTTRDGWMVVPNWFGVELLAAWARERERAAEERRAS
jgi:hypothetical protein